MATRIGRGRRSPGNIESVPGARDIVRRDTGHLAALKAPTTWHGSCSTMSPELDVATSILPLRTDRRLAFASNASN
jgi:hypothetical protein